MLLLLMLVWRRGMPSVLRLWRWQAVRHAIGRRVALMCMFHVVGRRQRLLLVLLLRRVWRRSGRIATRRMRGRGGRALLMRTGVVRVGAVYGRGRRMS